MPLIQKRFDTWANELSSINDSNLKAVSLALFRYQAEHNLVYKAFITHLGIDPSKINQLEDIPFLPIELFKEHQVLTGQPKIETVFESSGTTGQHTSKHHVADLSLYEQSFTKGFERAFGDIDQYCILALLPSYLERNDSSLVYMVNHLIQESKHPSSGFFLNNIDELITTLHQLENDGQAYILFGVTFALLDLAEQYPTPLEHAIIIETGGMKGRREEITRAELHSTLKHAFQLEKIYSEYGMTELLSQAYTKGGNEFYPPPWMKVLARDPYDPLTILPEGTSGALNVIDLANIHSCAFIATGDLTQVFNDGCFEVLGRMDNNDLRGCNLMLV